MFFEKYFVYFVLPILIGTLFLTFFSLVRLFLLRRRKKINFKNFKRKEYLFYLKKSIFELVLEVFLIVCAMVMIFIASTSNVLRIYLCALIPLLLVLGMNLYENLTIERTNKNLSDFRKFHSQIIKVKNTKEENQKRIDKANEIVDLKKYNYTFLIKLLNDILLIPLRTDFDQYLSSAINELEEAQKNNDLYQDSCVKDFDEKIFNFVNHGKTCEMVFPDLVAINENKIISLLKQHELETKKFLVNYSVDSLKNKNIQNNKSIVALLNINIEKNNDLSIFIKPAIECIDVNDDTSLFADFLFSKHLFNSEIALFCIEKRFLWIFSHDIYKNVSIRLFEDILKECIKDDDVELTHILLSFVDEQRRDLYIRVSESANVENRSKRLIDVYTNFLRVNPGFLDESNMLENMVYSLNDYCQANDKNEHKHIVDIINKSSFLKESEYIKTKYNLIKNKLDKERKPFMHALVAYKYSKVSQAMILDSDKCIEFFQTCLSTLNENGIKHLLLIMNSIVLLNDKEPWIVEESILSLKKSILVDLRFKNDINLKNYEQYGRLILDELVGSMNKSFIKTLYRVELNRLSYEKIIRLWGKIWKTKKLKTS